MFPRAKSYEATMEGIWSDPDVASLFSHMRGATSSVAEALQELHGYLRRPLDGPSIELEMRLGSRSGGRYQSDVGRSSFYTILEALESFSSWSHVTHWIESQDVFYSIMLPQGSESKDRKAEIRTTVGPNEANEITLKHQIKRRLKIIDFVVTSPRFPADGTHQISEGPDEEGHTAPALGLRFCVSIETPVPLEILPAAVKPSLVRIKQRKKFILSSIGVERPAFSFDMSIIYSGESKFEAESKQASQTGGKYEVEIECLEPLLYLQSCDSQETILALSLLLKASDLLALLTPQRPICLSRAT